MTVLELMSKQVIKCKESYKYLTIIPRVLVGYELATTNLISNTREWNNCFIKFSTFGFAKFC